MEDYKKEPGGHVRLNERNPKWLNDLYVKFIRLSSHLVEKNGEGILGFITNHGYLDNPTFRGMRWHLLRTFDRIWILDLHGNAKKREVTPAGEADYNVFDIQQGVSIIIAARTKGGKPDELASVMHGDLWGKREAKYEALSTLDLTAPAFTRSEPREPSFLLGLRDYSLEAEYLTGFSLKDLFPVRVLGFQTHRDGFAIADTRDQVAERIASMAGFELSEPEFHAKHGTRSSTEWQLEDERKKLRADPDAESAITKCLYRPFDVRWCHLSEHVMDRPRPEIIQHVLGRDNLCLLISRQLASEGYRHALVTDLPAESCAISLKTKEQNQVLPLYLYPSEADLEQERRVNLNQNIVARLRDIAEDPTRENLSEVDIFDYVYGSLYSEDYRETYAQFLKADIPVIPWPGSADQFWQIAKHGSDLRKLHLMMASTIGDTPFPFVGEGDGTISLPTFEDNKVWINETQHFAGVSAEVWETPIGGHYPAQKWLKDRRGRTISFDDVKHYQRVLKILYETKKIMESIQLVVG